MNCDEFLELYGSLSDQYRVPEVVKALRDHAEICSACAAKANYTPRDDSWFTTRKGIPFHPFSPRLEDIDITDIAHALSNVCRFGGHCRTFYSVAQHSVLVSRYLAKKGDDLARWGLVHDASEAYVGDLIRPIKKIMPAYKEAENLIERLILVKFGLTPEMPPEVKEADNVILACEARDLMVPPCGSDLPLPPDPAVVVEPWATPAVARAIFMGEFEKLFGNLGTPYDTSGSRGDPREFEG